MATSGFSYLLRSARHVIPVPVTRVTQEVATHLNSATRSMLPEPDPETGETHILGFPHGFWRLPSSHRCVRVSLCETREEKDSISVNLFDLLHGKGASSTGYINWAPVRDHLETSIQSSHNQASSLPPLSYVDSHTPPTDAERRTFYIGCALGLYPSLPVSEDQRPPHFSVAGPESIEPIPATQRSPKSLTYELLDGNELRSGFVVSPEKLIVAPDSLRIRLDRRVQRAFLNEMHLHPFQISYRAEDGRERYVQFKEALHRLSFSRHNTPPTGEDKRTYFLGHLLRLYPELLSSEKAETDDD